MIWKLLSLFLDPKSTNYYYYEIIDSSRFGAGDNPFLGISIISQSQYEDVVALRVDYILPSNWVSQAAQFITTNEAGEIKTDLWLRTGHIKNGKVHYLMGSIEKKFLENSAIKLNFDDGKLPVSNTYSYVALLSDLEVTQREN